MHDFKSIRFFKVGNGNLLLQFCSKWYKFRRIYLKLGNIYRDLLKYAHYFGLVRDLNPGPLAPKARIIPLDQRASYA